MALKHLAFEYYFIKKVKNYFVLHFHFLGNSKIADIYSIIRLYVGTHSMSLPILSKLPE